MTEYTQSKESKANSESPKIQPVFLTDCGILNCKKIIHIILPDEYKPEEEGKLVTESKPEAEYLEELGECFKLSLAIVNEMKLASLSIPLLRKTRDYDSSTNTALVDKMSSVLFQFITESTEAIAIQTVRLVSEDVETLKKFKNNLKQRVGSALQKEKDPSEIQYKPVSFLEKADT